VIDIRSANPDETAELLSLHRASIREFGTAAYDDVQDDDWADKEEADYPLGDDDPRFVVAERGGELAGFGDLHWPEAEVTAVYVAPDHAGEGVGSTILEALEAAARERGLDELGLLASRNAVGFYEEAGYERVEPRVHETGGEELECVWMEKALG
jgi:putative acetyltransferase